MSSTNRKPMARALANLDNSKKMERLIQLEEKKEKDKTQELLKLWYEREENRHIKRFIKEIRENHV